MFIDIIYNGRNYLIPVSNIDYIELSAQGFEATIFFKNGVNTPGNITHIKTTIPAHVVQKLRAK